MCVRSRTSPSAANGQRRFILAMILLFAATATLLAIVGLWRADVERAAAVHASWVSAWALGAARSQVLALVVRQGIWFGIAGMIGGLGMAFASTTVCRRSCSASLRATAGPTRRPAPRCLR
jgi:hypothetical protein